MERSSQYKVIQALREVPDQKYTVEDLHCLMDLTRPEAQDIHSVLNSNLYDRYCNMSSKDSAVITSYICETLHMSLDGWSDGDMMVIELFLHDLLVGLDTT